jgi:hypothetical protein
LADFLCIAVVDGLATTPPANNSATGSYWSNN